MREILARALPRWSEGHWDNGYLLGMYADGLEESRDDIAAGTCDLRAFKRSPADARSVHAVAHVMEMTEQQAEGIAWVQGLEADWSRVGNSRFHLHLHC